MALRWGVAGPGHTANDFVSALSTLREGSHVVVAVASDTRLTKAEEFIARHRSMDYGADLISADCKAYGSYDELVKDSNVQV